tara:strand:- start:195 stop:437 length:243 start_codon:yes stop_codon:yes gene_type:complete
MGGYIMEEITWEEIENFCEMYDFYSLEIWLMTIVHKDFNIELLRKSIVKYNEKAFKESQRFLDQMFDEVDIDPDGIGNRL